MVGDGVVTIVSATKVYDTGIPLEPSCCGKGGGESQMLEPGFPWMLARELVLFTGSLQMAGPSLRQIGCLRWSAGDASHVAVRRT